MSPNKKVWIKIGAEFDYSQPSTSTSTSETNNKLIDFTPDEGDKAARSSSSSPIPSEAECEDESKEEEGYAQVALDDPATWPNI